MDAEIITLETKILPGIGYFIVGLPDEAIKESLHRVESAINSAGLTMPRQKILISIAPAGLPKSGAMFDLPIAISILAASGQLDHKHLENYLFTGELSLYGKLRPVKGVLPMVIQAEKSNLKAIIVPEENASEAALLNKVRVYGLENLSGVHQFLSGQIKRKPTKLASKKHLLTTLSPYPIDFSEVKGQEHVKRAMEIAAAGGHNLIMIGAPGSGKTMLARRLPTIFPPLTIEEAIEITRLYSVIGQLEGDGLVRTRPFRSPHHTASDIAMVGGGTIPQPGEISMAHNGILFLDELPEFKRKVLEVLRQPLEEQKITVSRANQIATFPANFLLLAALNPCPCGFHKHPFRKCTCTPRAIIQYLNKTSGPLLDRIDLHIHVGPVDYQQLNRNIATETSNAIRQRVLSARSIQQKRQGTVNSRLTTELLKSHCYLTESEHGLLIQAMEKNKLSARSYDRILKVSRTIADLAGSAEIKLEHLAEAISLRCLDTDYFSNP